MRKQLKLDVQYLDERELRKRFSIHAPGAILSENAAYADAYLMTHNLLQYVKKAGIRIYDRTYVTKVNFNKRSVELTTENGHRIKAAQVIYATGYEATEIIKKRIVELRSTYVTVSESMSNVAEMPFHKTLVWNTADPYLYFRTTTDGRVLIGGRDEKFVNPAQRERMINKKTKALINDFHNLYPTFTFTPEFSWAGTFGTRKDGLPYIGTYGSVPNRYFALGFGGNGIVFSLIAAEMIRDSILGRKNQMSELFSFNRF